MTAYDARLGLYIAGRWHGSDGRDTGELIDPATGSVLASVPFATTADLDNALDAAGKGFERWRVTAPDERSAILHRAAALLRERSDQLSRIATLEQGKVLTEAKAELAGAASLLDFHAGETLRIYGRSLPRPVGSRSLVLPQPVGPVAAFCAWNYPILNVVRKLAPALAAGCSIILKPSEETPGSACEVMRCFQDAGLPGDVAQLVFGVPDLVSRHLLASPVTRKLSFTGSVPVGKHLMRLAADTVMRMTMELGGHSPVIVFDDCDVERALDILVLNKFRNAGQVCIAPTRFYVQEAIYDRFVAGFAERTLALKLGNGLDPRVHMGPMANARRPIAIAGMVEEACRSGARIVAGGNAPTSVTEGFFYTPTVLADVPLETKLMNHEPFGPIAAMRPFASLEEVIAEANRLPYGLAAYCFTENGRRQNILADELEAGLIAINGVRLSWPDAPFGGMKESGFGSEDGPEGIAAHMVSKSVHIM